MKCDESKKKLFEFHQAFVKNLSMPIVVASKGKLLKALPGRPRIQLLIQLLVGARITPRNGRPYR